MYLKAEFDLSKLAPVSGITNISKTLITLFTLGNVFPICFSLVTEMVWGRDFVCHFYLLNIISIVSIPAEKLMDLEGLHCNILIQALHLLLCIVLSC